MGVLAAMWRSKWFDSTKSRALQRGSIPPQPPELRVPHPESKRLGWTRRCKAMGTTTGGNRQRS